MEVITILTSAPKIVLVLLNADFAQWTTQLISKDARHSEKFQKNHRFRLPMLLLITILNLSPKRMRKILKTKTSDLGLIYKF